MKRPDEGTPLLVPGQTCWKTTTADRLGLILDAGPYYAALRDALPKAERSIYIVGWDVDSRTALSPQTEPEDGLPQTLLPFLNALLARNPKLHIHVLAWDYSFIYAFEREPLPRAQFSRGTSRRLHFVLDDAHPTWASHHQKIVVVDDRLAFAGGVDLTIRRWDTPEHRPNDPGRRDPAGAPYQPMHDVQVAVDGAAAGALADLVRARWANATGERLRPPRVQQSGVDLWPSSVTPDGHAVPLGLARTLASPRDKSAHVREIEALRIQALARARTSIYVENQYFTSAALGDALAKRLQEPDGPEVLLVLPEMESGWLERGSMGVLRAQALQKLQAADAHKRLAVMHPTLANDAGAAAGIPVHSKVLIIDDQVLEVGSANFSNRSLGLDSEIALAVDAAAAPTQAALVARARARLLGEHLGVDPADVQARLDAGASLLNTVKELCGGPRTLAPLPDAEPTTVNLAVLDGVVCDPNEPISPELFIDRAIPIDFRRRARRTLWGYAALVAALVAIGAAVRFGPWNQIATLDDVRAFARGLALQPYGPLLAFVVFVVAGVVFVPVTALVTTTLLTFGFWKGGLVAYAGGVTAASLSFFVGQLVGAPTLQRFLSPRLLRMRRQLAQRGFAAVLLARLLPVGNFAAINLLAGAFRVPFPAFVKGNLVGLLPGLLGLGVLADRVVSTFRDPTPQNVILLVVVAISLVGLVVGIKRLLRRPTSLPVVESRGQS